MTKQLNYKEACAALGKFVWYYHEIKAGQGISAPMPRPDGRPLDGTIVNVNDNGTVEVRIWQGGEPHVLDNVQIYSGDIVSGDFVVYPEDDQKRIAQATEKAEKDSQAAALEAYNQEKEAIRKAAAEDRSHAGRR